MALLRTEPTVSGLPYGSFGEKSHDARNCARWLRLADDPDVCYRENQEALKRYRLMPSFLILDSSVCRGIPNLTAAPVGPPTTPSDSRSAASSISFSCSARLATSGTDVIADFGATRVSQASSTKKVSPSHRITARSTTFCNSRMLPGQSYAWKSSMVFLSIFRIFLPAFCA